MKIILVIDYSYNWYDEFKGATTPSGEPIVIEQSEWGLLDLVSTFEQLIVRATASSDPFPFTTQSKDREFTPDAILVRNFPRNLHDESFENLVLAFAHAGLPCINSSLSILCGQMRPLFIGELKRIAKKTGMPLIPTIMYPCLKSSSEKFNVDMEFPVVVKVSNVHAGCGKMKCETEDQFDDLVATLALHKDYFTVEPFLPSIALEYRIQRIGKHTRVYKRQSKDGWKGNWGNIEFEDLPVEDRHVQWCDAISNNVFGGGLNMFAIDVIRQENGQETVLEVNDGAMGLMYDHEKEDCGFIRDLMIEKL